MKRQNVRTLSLIICTLTYLFRRQVERLRDQLMHKYNISDADYRVLETIIVKAIPHKAGHQWKFSGAFYFATTVITTIGLVMFQSIGERLNTVAAKILRAFKELFGRKSGPATVSHTDLIIICSALSLFLIAAGAWIFHRYEDWSYFDSLYYCFITLVTIGFGDFVALQKDGALQTRPEYVVFSLIFIVFGLTVISAAMNLLVLRFLTMNTEDEKRDQREAKLAAKGLVTINSLEGRRHYAESTSSSSSHNSEEESRSLDQHHHHSKYRRRRSEIARLASSHLGADPETASVSSCSCYQLRRGSEDGDLENGDGMRKRTSIDTGHRQSNASKTLPLSHHHHQLSIQPFYHSKSASGDAKASPLLLSLEHLKRQSFRKSKNYKPVEEGDEPKNSLEDEGVNPFRPHTAGPRHSNPFRGNRMSQDFNPFRD